MNEILKQVAEQVIGGTAGQVIDKAGYASIGTGIGIKVAEQNPVLVSSLMPATITEWAAFFSILGAVSLVIKNLFEIWWKVREGRKNGSPNS